jgi:hypothetical protein
VLSFFHTGRKFRIADGGIPPGTALYFSNMTVLVANATFGSSHSSGIMAFFELEGIARFCFINRCVLHRPGARAAQTCSAAAEQECGGRRIRSVAV